MVKPLKKYKIILIGKLTMLDLYKKRVTKEEKTETNKTNSGTFVYINRQKENTIDPIFIIDLCVRS